VTYLHFADPGQPALTRKDLPFCRGVEAIPKPAAYGALKMARGIVGRSPLPVLNYTSDEMSRAVARLTAGAANFDLVHLDSIHMIRYAGSSARVVYDWHNIESEALRRYSATVASRPRRWYAKQTAAKLEALEGEILRNAFGHVVCSGREREQLIATTPKARIAVVENGVDTGYFAGASGGSGQRDIVFVGTMDYYPNVEAASSFARNIWPRLRDTLPESRLMIVGANPTPQVRALRDIAGVTVTGTVPDVRPYYRDALAAIVPLRTGGGTRLKILEAMAAGVPVVSTPLGAEGLAVTSDRDILLVEPDDAAGWARHLSQLAQPSARRAEIVSQALELVRARYDWNTLGQKLWDTYAGWMGSGG